MKQTIEALSKHPVVGENASQLKKICAVPDELHRRAVIEALMADSELSADEARVQAGIDRPEGPAPATHQKFVNAVTSNIARLSIPQRREVLPQIVKALGSEGVKRQLRDLLNEELGDA